MRIKEQLFEFQQHWRDLIYGGIYRLWRRDLASILNDFNPSAELADRIAVIEELLAWIRLPVDPARERTKDRQIQAIRVRFLFQLIERNPHWREAVPAVLGAVLIETDPLNLFCLTGLARQSSLLSEAVDRLLRKVLPAPRNEYDLSELFVRVFRDESDADWLERLDSQALGQIAAMMAPTPAQQGALRDHFMRAVHDASVILSAQIEALGFDPEVRLRTQVRSVRDSAFWRIRRNVAQLESQTQGRSSAQTTEAFHQLLEDIQLGRTEIGSALSHLETHGVSVAIVYRLEQLERMLTRLETLVKLRFAAADQVPAQLWASFIATLMRDAFAQAKISGVFQDNLRLLSRKIVERAGESGEHYITRTKAEYLAMLSSAAGGGALTAVTTVLKFGISALKPALFFEGLLSWLNYAGSFLVLQALGFTLATKQPSMTAPALAAKLKDLAHQEQIDQFVDEVARLTRSQFAAVLGNLGAVIPAALIIDVLVQFVSGSPMLTEAYAQKVLASFNPLGSLTIFYAALTGVLLWASSVCAGWAANWVAFRRLPESIADAPLIRGLFGKPRAEALGRGLSAHVSGVAGSVSLGLFLAFTPIFGHFFGAPLDVRHVTLSTGALTFAAMALPSDLLLSSDFVMAVVGILFIGLLNFGVSFALALSVAIKARAVKREWLLRLAAAIRVRIRRDFAEFLIPRERL